MKYTSKYDTKFTCPNCGTENNMPCNFCFKCGEKLFKDKCLHCWRSTKKIINSKAKNCNECNVNKLSPMGLYK